jgi:hypothetical protein
VDLIRCNIRDLVPRWTHRTGAKHVANVGVASSSPVSLQKTRAPSRCYAAGLSRFERPLKLGVAGVPSGAAAIQESEILNSGAAFASHRPPW